MKRSHLVLFESKDYGWIAYAVMRKEAERLIKINSHIFYIFECELPYSYDNTIIKLKTPFKKYYETATINVYKEEVFEENEEYIIIKDEEGFSFQVICSRYI